MLGLQPKTPSFLQAQFVNDPLLLSFGKEQLPSHSCRRLIRSPDLRIFSFKKVRRIWMPHLFKNQVRLAISGTLLTKKTCFGMPKILAFRDEHQLSMGFRVPVVCWNLGQTETHQLDHYISSPIGNFSSSLLRSRLFQSLIHRKSETRQSDSIDFILCFFAS